MEFLEWKPSYSVGVIAIDHEHQEMIALINEIHAELGGRRDAVSIEGFLGDVHSAIAMHFALEEKLMREAGYEEYAAHKDDHEDLLDQIRDLMDTMAEDPAQGFEVLTDRLSAWFDGHFSTFDARLHNKLGDHH